MITIQLICTVFLIQHWFLAFKPQPAKDQHILDCKQIKYQIANIDTCLKVQ